MRLTEAIDIINREELPSDREFPFIYTHINKADAKELRRLDRAQKRKAIQRQLEVLINGQ